MRVPGSSLVRGDIAGGGAMEVDDEATPQDVILVGGSGAVEVEDEASVDDAAAVDLEVLKVISTSAHDKPLTCTLHAWPCKTSCAPWQPARTSRKRLKTSSFAVPLDCPLASE